MMKNKTTLCCKSLLYVWNTVIALMLSSITWPVSTSCVISCTLFCYFMYLFVVYNKLILILMPAAQYANAIKTVLQSVQSSTCYYTILLRNVSFTVPCLGYITDYNMTGFLLLKTDTHDKGRLNLPPIFVYTRGLQRLAREFRPSGPRRLVSFNNSGRKTYRTMSDCFHAERDLVAWLSTLIGSLTLVDALTLTPFTLDPSITSLVIGTFLVKLEK